jgi:acetoacetyl-CoA reductase
MGTKDNKKVILVTGGSRGIGSAISMEMGTIENIIVVNYNHNKDHADKVVDDIKSNGGQALAIQANISLLDDCKRLFDEIHEKLGNVDVLINNAGITRDKSFKKMELEEWNTVIDTNLSSAYNTTKLALPAMLENKFGRIINISSVIGQSGGFGQTNYAAAKAGLIGFSKSLALETAKYGVTVNTICPGFIGTDMVNAMPTEVLNTIISKIPVNRLGIPSEIAKGVRYLTESAYITGQSLNINGGLYMI